MNFSSVIPDDGDGYCHVLIDHVITMTDKAILIKIDRDKIWIPKSVVRGWQGLKRGDRNVEIEMVESFARNKEII